MVGLLKINEGKKYIYIYILTPFIFRTSGRGGLYSTDTGKAAMIIGFQRRKAIVCTCGRKAICSSFFKLCLEALLLTNVGLLLLLVCYYYYYCQSISINGYLMGLILIWLVCSCVFLVPLKAFWSRSTALVFYRNKFL